MFMASASVRTPDAFNGNDAVVRQPKLLDVHNRSNCENSTVIRLLPSMIKGRSLTHLVSFRKYFSRNF